MVLYTLTMIDLTDSDQGNYTCSLNANGTLQAQSINLKDIKTLQISSYPDTRDSFSDDGEFNLTCCSPDIGEFNVTWTTIGPAGGTGNPTSNTTCSIYSVTPSPMEFLSSVTSYTCNFQRNKGATISKTIKVTYYKKANITIPSSLKISTRKNLTVNCKTNMNVTKIIWTKDNNTVANSGLLQKNGVTPSWAGTYLCVVYQGSLSTNASLTVIIIPLPLTEEITVYPLQTYLTCKNTALVNLTCCVNDTGYTRNFTIGSAPIHDKNCSSSNINFDCNTKTPVSVSCVVFNSQNDNVTSKEMTISYVQATASQQNCKAQNGLSETPSGITNVVLCQTFDATLLGEKTFICNDGSWSVLNDDCYSAKISQELENVKDVVNGPKLLQDFPKLLENITVIAKNEEKNIQNSSKTLELMVRIISILANTTIPVDQPMMQNIITTVDIMVDKPSVWNRVANQSVTLLNDVETFAKNLNFNGNISFQNKSKNNNIQLFGQTIDKATDYNGSFSLLNLTGNVFIDLSKWPQNASKVITVTYGTIKDILAKPVNTPKVVNGLVMSTVIDSNSTVKISMSFSKSNTSLVNPECVWYDLVRDVWNSSGCSTTEENGLILCSCNHLTSFSILMGPVKNKFLDIISYIGVGISLLCLVVTLLIEALVWASVIKNKTSYIRHVCLVNIAIALLVADIWFIIGAALENNKGSAACKAAAFFSFFFYLSLFFWMLTTGLILFYRMVYILHDMSRKTMMIIAFLLGYGCPLLITIITVASTEPRGTFISSNLCWLDYGSKTFLAFVVPALSIVFINILILIVVIFKLMRPTVGEKPGREDRKTVIVIAKTMAVLNPLLGTTWGFGLGLLFDPTNLVIHGIFAALNSFQGLFILISTVLLDQKVRKAVRSSISSSYWRTLRSRVQTTSTDSSEQSRSRSKPRKNHARKKLYGKKAAYDLFAAADSSETTGSSYSALP
ncbi:adhesion G protein-coupled receptor F5-like [Rana temporaria]|uniref:adhesion G protein-coupled receptor F5-like n=1 Tax=Rana temporaria TaxID=8407 RepID=UPI001AACC2D7|nr:adhesion G protein-coupled receptor F5-like [Rana temporaria]XP_040204404.1 adhesion G protein-coupled receptor F5-like [Rana temporaria]